MSLGGETLVLLEAAVETALNRALRLDPVTFEQLARFEGKQIALELHGTGLTLLLLPGHDGIQVMSGDAEQADTVISGTPLALAELSFGDARRVLFAGEVTIRGDVETGQAFKRLLDHLDIDWEELLSRYTGDVVAHQLGDLFRGLQSWGRQARRVLGRNLAEFLHQESRQLATREAVAEFVREVDRLRDDSARLQQRVTLLQQHLPQADQTS
ncbi:MAG: SCP2 sterol-binding domain-containing protein [Thiohalophilus sp.]|uniref:ubiquinone biosynthesis accessory factor UbiJ n=1 Tax=Thiohalophilus sp. TaxID=3028392 RepID=UPI002870599C|nr:SCP2 sterol-binding domain-containing protein [Thiohalophilus sp.]MDR9435317.1 SCP2 sterol-binding domain-containing protein [Thiohalophilus sp.]